MKQTPLLSKWTCILYVKHSRWMRARSSTSSGPSLVLQKRECTPPYRPDCQLPDKVIQNLIVKWVLCAQSLNFKFRETLRDVNPFKVSNGNVRWWPENSGDIRVYLVTLISFLGVLMTPSLRGSLQVFLLGWENFSSLFIVFQTFILRSRCCVHG